MTTATSFQSIFGTAIQGMFITWENTYDDSLADLSTVTLDMTFQLNFHNMADLATGTDQAVPADGATPYLNFYLTFLNPDSDTITDIQYDAFVGMIQFKSVSANDADDSTKDDILWWPMSKTTSVTSAT